MLRSALLRASRSNGMRRTIEALPPTKRVAEGFVAGTSTADALRATRSIVAKGMNVTIDFLGEDITELAQAEATVAAYLDLIAGLAAAGLTDGNEVSVKLSALSQSLPAGGEAYALERVQEIVAAATAVGMLVTLDMEDHTTTDSTLRIVEKLRGEVPSVGCVLQASLFRTLEDAARLAVAGSRVRLTKGAYREPPTVAHQTPEAIDRAYVQALSTLMRGSGYVMVASHDPAMIAAASGLVESTGRSADSYELQMLFGIRPQEQERLVGEGHNVRVYIPYGDEWYGYFMRRLAERPANLRLFAKSLTSKS